MTEEQAADVTDDVWRLVRGVRRLHGDVDGDPLAGRVDLEGSGDAPDDLANLEKLEVAIDHLVCEWYCVGRRSVEGASVVNHHQLG